MKYEIYILRRAQKELAQLPEDVYRAACKAIRALAENPRPPGCLKLTGRDGWRIRVRKYRCIYEINNKDRTIIILHLGHRKDAY